MGGNGPPEEALVVDGGNRRDSWQDVPIDQQHLCHPIVNCEKSTLCMGNMAVLTNSRTANTSFNCF